MIATAKEILETKKLPEKLSIFPTIAEFQKYLFNYTKENQMGGATFSSLEEKAAAENNAAPIVKTKEEKIKEVFAKFEAELIALIKE